MKKDIIKLFDIFCIVFNVEGTPGQRSKELDGKTLLLAEDELEDRADVALFLAENDGLFEGAQIVRTPGHVRIIRKNGAYTIALTSIGYMASAARKRERKNPISGRRLPAGEKAVL